MGALLVGGKDPWVVGVRVLGTYFGNDDRDERQRNEKDRERERFATIVYIGELVDAEPDARCRHVPTRQHEDAHPR